MAYLITTGPQDTNLKLKQAQLRPMRFPYPFRINDSLESTIKYLCTTVEWIGDTIKKSKESILPFHVDLCIHYASTIHSKDDIDCGKQRATIEQMESALKRYYKSMGVSYEKNKFSVWLDKYGIMDDEDMQTVMEDDLDNSLFGEIQDSFDVDFPLVIEPGDKDAAFNYLLYKLYREPDCDFRRPYNMNEISPDQDVVGDIGKTLVENKSIYASIECDGNGIYKFYNAEFIISSWIRDSFNLLHCPKDILFLLSQYIGDYQWMDILRKQSFLKLINKFKELMDTQTNENWLKNKRFVILIDRRNTGKDIDTLWMYQPAEYAHIPSEPDWSWKFEASTSCLLPNNVNEKTLFLTFSFSLQTIEKTKCFLYFDDAMIRFTAKDITKKLPGLFTTQANTTFGGWANRKLVENQTLTSNSIQRINNALPMMSEMKIMDGEWVLFNNWWPL